MSKAIAIHVAEQSNESAEIKSDELLNPVQVNARSGGSLPIDKEELFSLARKALRATHGSLREVAEALDLARGKHGATQREMAEAVGMSAAWVNKLLKWRASGYDGNSPFGPTTAQDRVEHAKQRSAIMKSKRARIPGHSAVLSKASAGNAPAAQADLVQARCEQKNQDGDALAPEPVHAGVPSASKHALLRFAKATNDLDELIGKRPSEHFAATTVPVEILASVGKYLTDLADLNRTKTVTTPIRKWTP
jgi:hypothetical protein